MNKLIKEIDGYNRLERRIFVLLNNEISNICDKHHVSVCIINRHTDNSFSNPVSIDYKRLYEANELCIQLLNYLPLELKRKLKTTKTIIIHEQV